MSCLHAMTSTAQDRLKTKEKQVRGEAARSDVIGRSLSKIDIGVIGRRTGRACAGIDHPTRSTNSIKNLISVLIHRRIVSFPLLKPKNFLEFGPAQLTRRIPPAKRTRPELAENTATDAELGGHEAGRQGEAKKETRAPQRGARAATWGSRDSNGALKA